MLDMRAAILNGLSDQLDAAQVPQEQLELWADMEAKSLGCGDGGIPQTLRRKVLEVLIHFTAHVEAPPECWFSTVRLFDVATAKMCLNSTAGQAINRAGAAWLLCYKSEHVRDRGCGLKNIIDHLASTLAALSESFNDIVTVTKDAILAEERYLLQNYAADIGLPHVMKWITQIMLRTDITVRGSCSQTIAGQWAWAQGVAKMCTMGLPPASATNRPQCQAAAIVSISFLLAGWLQPETLAPGAVAPAITQGCPAERPDFPGRPKNQVILSALELAAGLLQSDWEPYLLTVLHCHRLGMARTFEDARSQ